MDEQESQIDFQALRAKFQDKEFLLGPPKSKPALPEKPKVIPPPLSPTHHLPSGARPSLLSSINQALESKTLNAPRVVFKEENKETKKPLIHSNSKPKDKSDGKQKESKDKTKENKEKLNENSLDHKEKNGKKLLLFGAQKESTAELVPASPPPKAKTQKKKNILSFMKSSKKDPAATSAEPILDSKTGDEAGPAPLIPMASDADNAAQESLYSVPKAVLPKIAIPEASAAVNRTTLSPIPEPPDFSPPPALIPEIPAFKNPPPQSETPPLIESPTLPVSDLPTQNKVVPSRPTIAPPSPPVVAPCSLPVVAGKEATTVSPSPPSTPPPSPPPRAAHALPPSPVLSPPPSFANSNPLSEASAPSPSPSELQLAAVSDLEATVQAAVDEMDSPCSKQERPISALSALERAEDLNTGKKTPPSDQRILSALEKARKKAASPLSTPTPPPEALPSHLDPTPSDVEFPPIDYEGKEAKLEVNGTEHRTASPALQNFTEEGSNIPLELVVVPPPPPRLVLPEPEALGPAPEKPDRPLSVNLSEFIPPPPLIPEDVPAPAEFSEPDTTELDDLADAYSPELPVSEGGNEEYTGHSVPDEPNHLEYYGNGIIDPEPEVHAETAHGENHQETPPQEQSLQPAQDPSPQTEDPQTPYQQSSIYESNDNVYEAVNVSSGKKKGKGNSGKKRKGAPKNPYVEAGQETVQEKPKALRFGRSEKKQNSDKPDEKELKKKEKQRLEKEKKELKEKQEREKKEQKEKEKRENEMKKKFSITGQEEAMYQAKVNATTKGRKHDLPVKSGDIVSIIRTTKCPKGKWLARDSNNSYGYVSVDHLEMDFKEILELGKKTPRNSAVIETETIPDGRVLNHFSHPAESFSDDSEEWACEDDDTFSPAPETSQPLPGSHTRTFSMPEMGIKAVAINHQHSHSDMADTQSQAKQEALQKLETFLNFSKSATPAPTDPEPERNPTPVPEEAVSVPQESTSQETEFDPTAVILPPPDLYADSMLDSSLYSESIKHLPR